MILSKTFFNTEIIVADRMAAAGRSTLLIEGGGASYGITGGDVDSRRPVSRPLSSKILY
jgi:hypothetical protein